MQKKQSNEYRKIILQAKQLHSFYQKKHLSEFASKVNLIPQGELAFEQAIMTDNLNRTDVLIIDRQVTDSTLKRKRLDLLALKQVKSTQYHFLLLEIKLGKNSNLKGQVKSQLDAYVNHVDTYFQEYKYCYEKHFAQKVELGLIKQLHKIEIVKPVKGQILVGSYSGIAESSINKLRSTYRNVNIKHFKYAL